MSFVYLFGNTTTMTVHEMECFNLYTNMYHLYTDHTAMLGPEMLLEWNHTKACDDVRTLAHVRKLIERDIHPTAYERILTFTSTEEDRSEATWALAHHYYYARSELRQLRHLIIYKV